jgi:uncharacterized repeat protein (TIGR01451 family)
METSSPSEASPGPSTQRRGSNLRYTAFFAALVAVFVALPVAAGHPAPATASPPPAATFNPNLLLQGSSSAAEPSIRTDQFGQSFVIAPIGVPAGCKAFRVTHDGSASSFLGFPDHTAGGGDCDWALGPQETTGVPAPSDNVLAYSSLSAADITVGKSDDGGNSFGPPNPGASQVAGDDRMWMAADPQLNAAGLDDVFMIYHDLSIGDIQLSVSVDGGQTYLQNGPIINPADVPQGQWEVVGLSPGNFIGNIVARRDPVTHTLTLYSIFETADSAQDNIQQGVNLTANYNRVYEAVGTVTDTLGGTPAAIVWRNYEIYHGPKGANYGKLFPITAVDGGGRVYAFWSDGKHILSKTDATGTGWNPSTAPGQIPNPAGVKTVIMPWAQGGKSDIADLVFYGAQNGADGNNDDTKNDWNVYMAQTGDGGSTWGVFQASDHIIHHGGICISGLGCDLFGGDRTLLDFFQVSIDPTNGAADIAYADDHASPGSAVLYFTRQCTGTSATTGNALTNDCVAPPPPPTPPKGTTCPGPQVVDFLGDAPNNLPGGDGQNMDNLDIKNAFFGTPDSSQLQVTMTVKDLEPPGGLPTSSEANIISAYWTVYWDYNGTTYFAQATVNGTNAPGNPTPAAGVYVFSVGTYTTSGGWSANDDSLTGNVTGTATTGPNGTFVITFPRSDVSNPANGAKLTNTWADTHGSLTVLGTGLYYTAPSDRAPDSNYGADYFVGQTCPPAADLSVTKTDSPDPVSRNNTLTYTIKVHNGGPDPAQNVQMTDTLPSSVTWQSTGTSQGSCSGTSTVTCSLGPLTSGSDATVTIMVKVNSNAPSTISNTATASSTTSDPDPDNNSSTAETTVNTSSTTSADVSVTKSDSPDPVNAGDQLTYTIEVHNSGPDAAQSVQMTDTLPADVTFKNDHASQGSCSGTTTVTCTLGTINANSSATVTIVVKVNSNAPSTISNTASASSTTPDPNPSNNSDTETTAVVTRTQMPGYSAISSNFNGTKIAGGSCIWFNGVLQLVGNLPTGTRTVHFTNSMITFTANNTPYTIQVPDGTVEFGASGTATVTYNSATGWDTKTPVTGDNVFLDGVMYKVPSGGLPGGIKPVTWSGNFSSDGPVQFNWQWAAAVYKSGACPASNPADDTYYNGLQVKPVHSNTLDNYNNGDQAGTPEHIKGYVTGGATGGGGSNYTGSYSGTAQVKP